MISERYEKMLTQASKIREAFAYAIKRGEEIGYDNVFDFSLGNPSVPAPEGFNDTLIRITKEIDSMALHSYNPGPGNPVVRERVAKYLSKKFDIPYKTEDVFMVSGCAGAVCHAVRAVTNPGEEVITFAPFFGEYIPYVEGSDAVLKVVPADTENFQINFEAFRNTFTEKTAAVLVNTPNNPTGVCYSTKTLEMLVSIIREKEEEYGHDIYIITDEPYREIVFEGVDAPCVSKFFERTIMCYSFSKSLSIPGERIGYLAVNPACQDAAKIVNMCVQISRGIGHNCPSALIMLAVSEHLEDTSDLSVYETNKNILCKELKELGFEMTEPGGTFYMFPKALEEDSEAFCIKARKYDLVLVPGEAFGCSGFFRIAYCVDTDKVLRSIPKFKEFVEKEYPNV